MTPSPYTITFSDCVDNEFGIQISFREGDEVKHTEFMGDVDYNGAIVDWVLFGVYRPLIEREQV